MSPLSAYICIRYKLKGEKTPSWAFSRRKQVGVKADGTKLALTIRRGEYKFDAF